MPIPDPTYITFFATLFAVLIVIAALAVVWMRLWWFLIAATVRAAVRVGLYTPPSTPAHRQPDFTPDRGILGFTRLLRMVSRAVPGDMNKPRKTIIPLLLVGVPVGFVVMMLLWVTPLLLLVYVFGSMSGPLAAPVAVLSAFCYLAVMYGLIYAAKGHVFTPTGAISLFTRQ